MGTAIFFHQAKEIDELVWTLIFSTDKPDNHNFLTLIASCFYNWTAHVSSRSLRRTNIQNSKVIILVIKAIFSNILYKQVPI